MNAFIIFIVVIGLILAFVLGIIRGLAIKDSKKAIGTFKINLKDPSEELFSLKFDADFDEFEDAQYVTFRVMKV